MEDDDELIIELSSIFNLEYLTLDEYFDIEEILNEDEYAIGINDKGEEYVTKKPLPKKDRTSEFQFNLCRKVVDRIFSPDAELMEERDVILAAVGVIFKEYAMLHKLVEDTLAGNLRAYPTYMINDMDIKFHTFDKWVFDRWCYSEYFIANGSGQNDNKIAGKKYILPMCYGEWYEDRRYLQIKFNYFNHTAKAQDVLPAYIMVLHAINKVKQSSVPDLYVKGSGGSTTSSPYMSSHFKRFGWMETKRNLATQGTCGNWLTIGKEPLYEVLEFLNLQTAHNTAADKDYKHNNNK